MEKVSDVGQQCKPICASECLCDVEQEGNLASLGARFLTWRWGWWCFPRLPLRLVERASSVTAATNGYSVPTACQVPCSPPSGEQKRPSRFLVVDQDKFALNHKASALQV